METSWPTLYLFSSSWTDYFLVRLIYFLYTGCITLRLTLTVIVFSALSDTTTPFKILFGMSYFLPFIFLLKFNAVLIIAICFFTTEILAVFSSWPELFWNLRFRDSFLKTLILSLRALISSLISSENLSITNLTLLRILFY